MNRSLRFDSAGVAGRGDAWSEVTELSPSSYRVRLGGPFRGAWLAHLSGRLAEQRISIDQIHARCENEDIWIAELHLLALSGAGDPLAIDYPSLAELGGPTRSAFELTSYRLLDSDAYGGSLSLTLEAPDSLGLLGALLSSLTQVGLFPVELHIETREGRAHDSLWLVAAGSSLPSDLAREAARRLLDQACVSAR